MYNLTFDSNAMFDFNALFEKKVLSEKKDEGFEEYRKLELKRL